MMRANREGFSPGAQHTVADLQAALHPAGLRVAAERLAEPAVDGIRDLCLGQTLAVQVFRPGVAQGSGDRGAAEQRLAVPVAGDPQQVVIGAFARGDADWEDQRQEQFVHSSSHSGFPFF